MPQWYNACSGSASLSDADGTFPPHRSASSHPNCVHTIKSTSLSLGASPWVISLIDVALHDSSIVLVDIGVMLLFLSVGKRRDQCSLYTEAAHTHLSGTQNRDRKGSFLSALLTSCVKQVKTCYIHSRTNRASRTQIWPSL
jgi:hypothetical protein